MNKRDSPIIPIILFVLLILFILYVCVDEVVDEKHYSNGQYDAELIMPGNTVVVGQCTGFTRVSDYWVKVRVNGKWYNCNPDRIVLKERDNK